MLLNVKRVPVLRKMLSYAVVISMFCSLFMIAPVTRVEAASVTLLNNSFETVSGGFPVNWVDTTTTAFESSSTTRAYDGSRSVKINDTSSSLAAGVQSDGILAIPGRTYTANVMSYLESGTAYLSIEFWNHQGVRIHEQSTSMTTVNSWQNMSTSFQAMHSTKYVKIRVYSTEANTGIAYYDAATLTVDDYNFAEAGVVAANSGFEDVDANGFPLEWTKYTTNGFESGSTTRASEGTRSLKINDTSASLSGGVLSKSFPVLDGKQYTVTLKYYVESGGPFTLFVKYRNYGKTLVSSSDVSTTTTGSWQTLTLTTTAPYDDVYGQDMGTKYAEINLYSNAGNIGVAYFDDVRVYADSIGLSNVSFEDLDLNGYPSQWAQLGPVVKTSSSLTRAYDTVRSMKIEDSSSSDSGGARSNRIMGVTAGKEYIAAAQTYIESGSIRFSLEFWNSSNTRLGFEYRDVSTTGSWQSVSLSGTAPAGTSYATVLLYSNVANIGTAYFDAASFQESIVNVGTTKQLFIDDYLINSMSNVTRTMNQATKTSSVLTATYTWEGLGQTYEGPNVAGTVLYDSQESLFKMWYQTYAMDPSLGVSTYYTNYATSSDGTNWTKPNLGLVSFNGSTNNNIMATNRHGLVNVIKDTNEPDPYKRYKMMYYGGDIDSDSTIEPWYMVDYSTDGINWRQYNMPVLSGWDVETVAYDYTNNKFIAAVKTAFFSSKEITGGQFGHRIQRMSTSTDFENWTTPIHMESLADSLDSQGGYLMADSYGVSLYPYEGVYIGMDWLFKISDHTGGDSGLIEQQLVFSRDLTEEWKRPSRTPAIPLGASGEWDDGMINTASYPVQVGNEIWWYYGGADEGHESVAKHRGIAIAKWRLDGFMSLNSSSTEGTVQTKKLTFSGSKLKLNVNSSGTGNYVKVELLDANGTVIPGYSKNDSSIINTDNVNQTVTWGGSSNISALAGQTIQVKVYTKGAKLYAMQFGN